MQKVFLKVFLSKINLFLNNICSVTSIIHFKHLGCRITWPLGDTACASWGRFLFPFHEIIEKIIHTNINGKTYTLTSLFINCLWFHCRNTRKT